MAGTHTNPIELSPASLAAGSALSLDAYLALDKEIRGELIDGKFEPMSPPGFAHAYAMGCLVHEIKLHLKASGLPLVVVPEMAVIVEAGEPARVRALDVGVVEKRALADGLRPNGHFYGAPLVAVEIRSPSQRRATLVDKFQDYAALGVRECWLVDTDARSVEVFARDLASSTVFDDAFPTIKSQAIQDLRIAVGDLFLDA